MARNSLSSVDNAWLRMEEPANLMMITGVLVFGAPLDYERLKATIQKRVLRFGRFHQRIVQPILGAPYWEDDPDFNLGYHVQLATLPPPGDQAALQDMASLLASRQLDPTKPLWQLHFIEEYGEGCALICRLHHCIGDGLALVHVLLSLTDTEPDTPWPVIEPQPKRAQRPGPMRALLRPAQSALKTARQVTGVLAEQCHELRHEPSHAVDLARTGVRGTTALARLLFLWPDRKTVFKGPLDVPKRAAWSMPIPLQDIKLVGGELGGTVNDVLLTAMSGALRRYLLARGERVDGLNVRAIVPVDLRKPGTEEELGNKFGLVFLSLPIGLIDPGERLGELRRRMDSLKDTLEAPVAYGILSTIGVLPQALQDVVVNIFGLKGTAVMTNVVGPKGQLYLAGAPLESLMFWVPQSGHLGLGVSILSYNGRVWMGTITDAGLVPDPDAIIDAFHGEFDELLEMARKAQNARKSQRAQEQPVGNPKAEELVPETGEAATAEEPEGVPAQCRAITQAGKRCQNRAQNGSEFCHVHQNSQG
ncbi:MAG: wax ester/triacylglycerol synthase family O-acyltransferase [Anaerolineae bacterium]